MDRIDSTPDLIRDAYQAMGKRLAAVREHLRRPMTLAEKVLLSHLDDPKDQELKPGESYLQLRPDRVAMQDATAQMAILQFGQARIPHVAAPSTVHCDHLIRARSGAEADMATAISENKEVYDFLKSACAKYGIGFWGPGAGIIHQVVLEQYAFPGGMLIGTDSHTPNAGGLGMFASGVGGADAVDVMAGLPWEVLYPRLVGVKLTGKLSGWTAPKDIILKLCGILTCDGGTNRVIEYFGPGARAISCTGKATIANMGAELGATTSLFPFDEAMDAYLRATGRAKLADLAQLNRALLEADPEIEKDPATYFDRVVEIDLTTLEPQIVGPHTPDLARGVSELGAEAKEKGYPDRFSVALIGSCTNSSYEDICRAADVAVQAKVKGMKTKIPLLVTPGSEQIRLTIERDGQMEILKSVGATVLANACGPCIGQWKRDEIKEGQANAILTSYNRNFPKRNDGLASTMCFIGSPEAVVAWAFVGDLAKNPLQSFNPPQPAPPFPEKGYVQARAGYMAPPADGSKVRIQVSATSERLQLLEPFPAWDGQDLGKLPLLLKATGKCTTDHISPAGPWLKYRGHLDRISDNMFLGAVNAFTGEAGKDRDGTSFPQKARGFKAKGLRWVAVGDTNYGEGSSREHAAMSPRFLGCAAVITRSFARIHAANLKKQGILPLTFALMADYDRVREDDRISLLGLKRLAPGQRVDALLHHADGTEEEVVLHHTLNAEQILWFKAGSALNRLREQAKA
jgi:aconitate hydratase